MAWSSVTELSLNSIGTSPRESGEYQWEATEPRPFLRQPNTYIAKENSGDVWHRLVPAKVTYKMAYRKHLFLNVVSTLVIYYNNSSVCNV